jgi:hypothetical protein
LHHDLPPFDVPRVTPGLWDESRNSTWPVFGGLTILRFFPNLVVSVSADVSFFDLSVFNMPISGRYGGLFSIFFVA